MVALRMRFGVLILSHCSKNTVRNATIQPRPKVVWISVRCKHSGNQGDGKVGRRVFQRFWEPEKVGAGSRTDDGAVVRGVYLDLAGRIPTGSEARSFINDHAKNKRARLVDSLLALDDYA